MAQPPCLDTAIVDICDDCCDDTFTGMDPARADQFKRMALQYLWVATGRQYGLCEKTFRPCRLDCSNLAGIFGPIYPALPYKMDGNWFNLTCGKCPGSCGCDMVSEVFIQNTDSVIAIEEDGVVYNPFGIVAVYDRERIIRVDGLEWPACQNLSQIGGTGVWSITIMQGKPWPAGIGIIAGLLACELAKACTGSNGCRLPQRVQTITRQNVTIGFQDRFEGLPDFRTGLWEIDSFIEAARSTAFLQASIVSPDWTEPAQLTWPTDESPGSP